MFSTEWMEWMNPLLCSIKNIMNLLQDIMNKDHIIIKKPKKKETSLKWTTTNEDTDNGHEREEKREY